MKMFYWSSMGVDYFQNFGTGQVVVQAPNVNVAMDIACAEFEKKLNEEYSYLFIVEDIDELDDECKSYSDSSDRASDCIEEFRHWLENNSPRVVNCVLLENLI